MDLRAFSSSHHTIRGTRMGGDSGVPYLGSTRGPIVEASLSTMESIRDCHISGLTTRFIRIIFFA